MSNVNVRSEVSASVTAHPGRLRKFWTRARKAIKASRRSEQKGIPLQQLMRPYLRSQRGRLAAMSFVSILSGFADATTLVIIAQIAFTIADGESSVSFDVGPVAATLSITTMLFIAAGLAVVRVCTSLLSTLIAARMTRNVITATRKQLIRSYLRADWTLQSTQREGAIQDLLMTFASTTAAAMRRFTGLLSTAFNLFALLATALLVNAVAALAAATTALIVGLVLRPLRLSVRRRSSRASKTDHEFATSVTEITSTLQEVRIFKVGDAIRTRIEGTIDKSARQAYSAQVMGGIIPTTYQGTAMVLLILGLAISYWVGSGLASIGAVVIIMLRTFGYAQGLQGGIQGLNETAPYLEKLQIEMERYQAAALPEGGDDIAAIGTIRFDDVSFEYVPGRPVLQNIDFEVQPGEIIGIVGPSGAGKSTLVQLLLRLRDPTEGAFLVDGRDTRELSIDSWYDHVTFVPQDAHLFAGTVAENIRFFRDFDQDAIERAAKSGHIHDDIVGWPDGYDTPVGERGGQLSGGQRQRLSIARALVEEPDVVVLDEPTSALDVKSEALLRDTLAALAPRNTVFVIAHRLSTLSICDRIMVILDGRLQGFDRPDLLEATNPFYREALRLSGMR